MNKELFRASLPMIEEWKGLTAEHVQVLLLRAAGFLEALEGVKANPEIASRLNLNELRLLQTMVKITFGLQLQVFDLESKIEKLGAFQNENNQLHESLAHAIHVKGDLEDELKKLKETHEKESL